MGSFISGLGAVTPFRKGSSHMLGSRFFSTARKPAGNLHMLFTLGLRSVIYLFLCIVAG
jgi:hypothetical protein